MDLEAKTEYIVTWIIRDKDGNIKEMGNDSPGKHKEENKWQHL